MKLPLILLIIFCAFSRLSGQSIEQQLDAFDKIVVSPKINLVLRKGNKESITVNYNNIEASRINIEVKQGKLLLYLDHARFVEKRNEDSFEPSHEMMYANAEVTATVVYDDLKSLEVRGEQDVIVDILKNSDFLLKAYGKTHISFDTLQVNHLRVKMYGNNHLEIESGNIKRQEYTLYGENKVDTHKIQSETVDSMIYGDGWMRINATEEMLLTAFGDPSIVLKGSAHVHKGIVIGDPKIYK